ncbi:MAG: LssY C-terminal domain-containing protein, partial [Streptosporangiaceae bacterium]
LAAVTGAVLLTASIAIARLYLGADQLSTVVVSMAFGVAWTALLSIAYFAHVARPVRSGGLLAVAGVVLLVAGGISVGRAQQTDLRRYTAVPKTQTMTLADWERTGWAVLPINRLDLLGSYGQPFNVQWAGGLKGLAADLEAHGWRPPVGWTLRSTLEWLAPKASPASLPVLPRLDSGRPEKLVLIRTGNGIPDRERLVLRLWQSDTVLTAGPVRAPLWLGSLATERIAHVAWLATITGEAAVSSSELQKLSAMLPVSRVQSRSTVDSDPNWDGSLLVSRAERFAGLTSAAQRSNRHDTLP